jgi:hypothetical protein
MSKYKITHGFITQKTKSKLTIFDPEESIMYSLNDAAMFIFLRLKRGIEEKKIVELFRKKYALSDEEAARDVTDFIAKLKEMRLLVELK